MFRVLFFFKDKEERIVYKISPLSQTLRSSRKGLKPASPEYSIVQISVFGTVNTRTFEVLLALESTGPSKRTFLEGHWR